MPFGGVVSVNDPAFTVQVVF